MKLAIIGTGYVGLVTGTCFAESGNQVTCVDIDETKIRRLQNGEPTIYEPGLKELFQHNLSAQHLRFTTDLSEGIEGAEAIFLCLPTPPGEDGSADLHYVYDVSEKLGPLLKDYVVVVNKSTVPVGTAEKVRNNISMHTKAEFDVASNPEFLREGVAISDFMKPDRIVVGTSSDRAKTVFETLYQPFTQAGSPLLFMDEKSAEITKYAANAFLSTKISFMNEIANLAEKLEANVDDIRRGIGADERIGSRFLLPGPGFGGSCFPKDIMALERTAAENDYDLQILQAVLAVNVYQRKVLFEKLQKYFDGNLKDKTIAIWGLAFKANTDDIRESPALSVAEELLKAGAKVRATDPEAVDNARRQFADRKDIEFSTDKYETLCGADALVIMTEWGEYRSPDFAEMKKQLKAPVVFDGRNLYDLAQLKHEGFYYNSLGRQTIRLS